MEKSLSLQELVPRGVGGVQDTAVILRSKALPLREFMVPKAGRN